MLFLGAQHDLGMLRHSLSRPCTLFLHSEGLTIGLLSYQRVLLCLLLSFFSIHISLKKYLENSLFHPTLVNICFVLLVCFIKIQGYSGGKM